MEQGKQKSKKGGNTNMKEINMQIRVTDNKIATAWKTDGYSRENISDLFEMIGILENFKGILTDKVKTLMEKKI